MRRKKAIKNFHQIKQLLYKYILYKNMSHNIKDNEISHQSEEAIAESIIILIIDSRSMREEFIKTKFDFIDKSLETTFKDLNKCLISTINSTFSSFGEDFEKKLDKNREIHEKTIEALNSDLKKIKEKHNNKKITHDKQEEEINKLVSNVFRIKLIGKMFRNFRNYKEIKKLKKNKFHVIADMYLPIRKKRLVFNSWRNIINSLQKGRIKMKFGKLFTEKYNALKGSYSLEISRLQEILEKLNFDIQKEIEERKSLSKLYDINMNKGIEVFVKETNSIIDFNSSSNFL
jgi:hypothetical protein